jgi:hypothetical protein
MEAEAVAGVDAEELEEDPPQDGDVMVKFVKSIPFKEELRKPKRSTVALCVTVTVSV